MKMNRDLNEIKAMITAKVDNSIDYLIGVGNEINDVLNAQVEKRIKNLPPNSEKRQQELEVLSKKINLEFADLNHKIYFSIGNFEKQVLKEIQALNREEPNYNNNLDKIMRFFDYELNKKEENCFEKLVEANQSFIKIMDDIVNKSNNLNKFGMPLRRNPENLLRKNDRFNFDIRRNNEGKRSFEMQL